MKSNSYLRRQLQLITAKCTRSLVAMVDQNFCHVCMMRTESSRGPGARVGSSRLATSLNVLLWSRMVHSIEVDIVRLTLMDCSRTPAVTVLIKAEPVPNKQFRAVVAILTVNNGRQLLPIAAERRAAHVTPGGR